MTRSALPPAQSTDQQTGGILTGPATWLLVVLGALGTGLLAARQPALGVGLCLLFLLSAAALRLRQRLPQVALIGIGVSLTGYAFLGKGYAYLGAPPIFVGELTLLLGLAGWLYLGRFPLRHTHGLLFLMLLFMLVGLASTVPYLGRDGLDAVRDAVVWLYALFALVVAVLTLQLNAFGAVLQRYRRLLPWFLALVPSSLSLYRLFENSVPLVPGTDVPLLYPKGGDIAVHLGGILAFLLLGLHQRRDPHSRNSRGELVREWLLWLLWLVGVLEVATGRAALLALGASILCVMVLRPGTRWGRPLYLGVMLFTLLVASNFKLNVGVGRDVSAQSLLLNVQGITEDTGTPIRDGSRAWRLQWWNTITEYTVHGPYFWTGKGYGINLAESDGFRVTEDNSLRSPHSVNFTFLARSGVPGLAVWVLLQLTFAFSLLRAHLQARRAGQPVWASVFLWLLAYWLAFIVNASFDVYLEGPQGGIWFWCLFGFGLAALERYRQQRGQPGAHATTSGPADLQLDIPR
jgi:O-Antigen ligase